MNKFFRAISITAVVCSAGTASLVLADDHSGKSMDHSAMMSMDTNKDGMLSKSELKSDKKMTGKFDKMDANGDGMLDSTEMGGMGSGTSRDTMPDSTPGSGTGSLGNRSSVTPATP